MLTTMVSKPICLASSMMGTWNFPAPTIISSSFFMGENLRARNRNPAGRVQAEFTNWEKNLSSLRGLSRYR